MAMITIADTLTSLLVLLSENRSREEKNAKNPARSYSVKGSGGSR